MFPPPGPASFSHSICRIPSSVLQMRSPGALYGVCTHRAAEGGWLMALCGWGILSWVFEFLAVRPELLSYCSQGPLCLPHYQRITECIVFENSFFKDTLFFLSSDLSNLPAENPLLTTLISNYFFLVFWHSIPNLTRCCYFIILLSKDFFVLFIILFYAYIVIILFKKFFS